MMMGACANVGRQLQLLLGHTVPRDDELFSSWIARLAAQNGMDSATFATNILRTDRIWSVDIDNIASAETVGIVADKAGAAVERVRDTLFESYENVLFGRHNRHGLNNWIMPLGAGFRTRERFGLQFCAYCLAEGTPYFRRIWRLAWCVMCARHKTALLDRCVCGAAVRAYRRAPDDSQQIGSQARLNQCDRCGFDLRKCFGIVYDLAITCAALDMQVLCVRAIDDGGVGIGAMNVPSIMFFTGVRQLIQALLSGRLSSTLRAIAARGIGRRSLIAFSGHERATERTEVGKRTLLVAIVGRWLIDWPIAFISDCKEAGLAYHDICPSRGYVPYWLAAVLDEHFSRSACVPSRPGTRGVVLQISKNEVARTETTVKTVLRSDSLGRATYANPQLELPIEGPLGTSPWRSVP